VSYFSLLYISMNNAKLSFFSNPRFSFFNIFFKQKAKKEEKIKTHSIHQYMPNSLSITHKLLDGFIKACSRADFKRGSSVGWFFRTRTRVSEVSRKNKKGGCYHPR
jgi:hypothetical protein